MSSDLASEADDHDLHAGRACHTSEEPAIPSAPRPRDARTRIIIGLFAIVAFAWALTILASIFASGTSGRALAAMNAIGGHGHMLASDVTAGSLSLWVALALTVVSWVLMTTAMMLPSSVGMLTVFAATAQKRPRWKRSFLSFVGGYFVIWTGFGIVAFAFSLGIVWLTHKWGWLADNRQVVPAVALITAALWQLTPLKDACLKACRHPLSFMMKNFRSSNPKESFVLGIKHGVYCFGCCWALMLVMVFSGTAMLATMGVLALIMLTEKAIPWGERLVRPIGVALALAAVAMLFMGGGAYSSHMTM